MFRGEAVLYESTAGADASVEALKLYNTYLSLLIALLGRSS